MKQIKSRIENLEIRKLREKYKDVFDVGEGKLHPDKTMKGKPIDIELREGYIPHKIYRARPYPVHYKKEAEQIIKSLLEQKIICKQTEKQSG